MKLNYLTVRGNISCFPIRPRSLRSLQNKTLLEADPVVFCDTFCIKFPFSPRGRAAITMTMTHHFSYCWDGNSHHSETRIRSEKDLNVVGILALKKMGNFSQYIYILMF